MQICTFSAGGQSVAIPAEWVIEVAPLEGLVLIPTAPDFVVGLVARRGAVVPVMQLPPPLKREAPISEGQALLVIGQGALRAALPVDHMSHLSTFEASPTGPDPEQPGWLASAIEGDHDRAVLIDPAALFAHWADQVEEAA